MAPTILNPGDIAIAGYITNGTPDSFSFINLVDITAGTTIYFTDNGWTGSGFRGSSATDGDGNEGLIRFTADSDIAAGTVIRSNDTSSNFTWTKAGAIGNTSSNYGDLLFAQSGDQIAAFQSANLDNPLNSGFTAIYQVDNTGAFENATSSATGSVITGLSEAANTAVLLANTSTYAAFNLNTLAEPSTKEEWLSAINNSANWTFNNTGTQLPTGTIAIEGGTLNNGVNLSVSSNNASEADETTITLTVTAANAVVGEQSVTVNVSGTGIDLGDYNLSNSVITIADGATSGSATFTVVNDTLNEGLETAVINITNPSAGITLGNTTSQSIAIADNDVPVTRIRDIQGSAHLSSLAGQNVTGVAGIVTAVAARGFYLQDPNPDSNDATSEAIFVFTSSAPTVQVGDSISVNGRVSEFRPGNNANNLTLTQITSPVITKISSGNALPEAIIIGEGGRAIPNQIIDNDATNVEIDGSFDPNEDGIDFFESLEGMRVQINNPLATSPTNNFGEFWVLGDGGANATGLTARGGSLISPNDFNPERIQIDDTLLGGATNPLVNVGDRLGNIVGVVDYSFSNYEVLPTVTPTITAPTSLTKEVTNIAASVNRLTVATFNVENLDPGDGATKFNNIATRIVNNLKSPDIITVEEVQDNNGATNDAVVDASTTYQTLIDAIAAAGGPRYEFRQVNPVDDADGGEPGGNIRQGFLFNPDRVDFVDRPGGGSLVDTTVVNIGGVPQLSASPGRINPDNPAFASSRKPLVGEFVFNGKTVFIVGNHFNSKGGDEPLFGPNQPPELTSEAQRNQQATIVANFVKDILAVDANANVIVAGDLNDFEFSNPLNILKDAGLTSLSSTLPANERYTYNFQGNAQTLDHILVSGNLVNNLDGYDIVHINSEFADQDSDHDPSVAGFNLVAINTQNGTGEEDTFTATAASDRFFLQGGNDTVVADIANLLQKDALDGGTGSDRLVVNGGTSNAALVLNIADSGNSTLTGLPNLENTTISSFERFDFTNFLGSLTTTGSIGADNIVGGLGSDNLKGGAGNDTLKGGEGSDTLDGGTDIDFLVGGAGDDFYIVDAVGDGAIELPGGGLDTVSSSASYTLGVNLENLTLTGSANINGTGNALDNAISGNSGNNNLRGSAGNDKLEGGAGNDILDGGTGDDTLIGSTSNDTYIIDSASDTVTENPNEGTDAIASSISFSLATTPNVENLVLTGDALNATGSSVNNTLTGNSFNNVLSGDDGNDFLDGKAGDDTLVGGKANDTYVVDTLNDAIIENANEGTDTVRSSLNYSLAGVANVENLILLGSAVNGTGNTLNNSITGNSGDNSLFGLGGNDVLTGGLGNDLLVGGASSDSLIGGLGNDIFRFDSSGEGRDIIRDFEAATDILQISAGGFGGGLALGSLSTEQILIGAGVNIANSAEQRFIYNTSNGALFFDADGNGSGSSVQIATLSNKAAISASNFSLIA